MSASKIVLTDSDLRRENPEKYYSWGDEAGRGEFAVIKKCAAKGKGIEYAAKFIKYLDDNDKMMAVREYDIIKNLDHRNINKMIEGFIVRKYIVLILEFVGEKNILTYISVQPGCTEELIASLTRQTMDALNYIHQQAIVHLDIRPDNLMVNPSGVLKIIDFGCARKLSQGLGAIGEVAGNSEFRAPELFKFDPANISADIWSYGIILFAIIVGKVPYTGESDDIIVAKMNKTKVELSAAVWKKHSDALKDFLKQLVVSNPDKRMTAAQALEHQWLSVAEARRRKTINIDRSNLAGLISDLKDQDDDPIVATCVLRDFDEAEFESPEESSEEEEDSD